jgi:sulfonate transport system permease protein
VIWSLLSLTSKIAGYLLPSPWTLIKVALDFAFGSLHMNPYSGTLWKHALSSIGRVLWGFVIASVSGLILGFLTGRSSLMKKLLDPLVHILRTVPGIGWLPIAMVWFGIGVKTTVFLIALAAFFPVYLNTFHGAASVPILYIRAGKMLGAGKYSIFSTVIIPSAFPSVAVGLRLGLGISWAYLVLGELTGVTNGLGAVMMDARMLGDVEMILVSMIYIALIGRLCDILLLRLLRLFQPYGDWNVE